MLERELLRNSLKSPIDLFLCHKLDEAVLIDHVMGGQDAGTCLLTYKSISAYDVNNEGYQSSYGWITVEAYQEFIANDRLRVRTHCKSIERSK